VAARLLHGLGMQVQVLRLADPARQPADAAHAGAEAVAAGLTVQDAGSHEDTIEQMDRLFRERLYNNHPLPDEAGRIRIDDWEMSPEIQSIVGKRWEEVNTGNLNELADFEGYQAGFLKLFGFGLDGVDYGAETDTSLGVPSLS
jgi:enoyl-[acyl-carrier protein] reductase/trans-2-enoyl-CoA reductase (NAD+)